MEDGRERDDFYDPTYWDEFYAGDDEPFDWYSSEEWLADAVSREARRIHGENATTLARILDVGCGTSPLLYRLASDHGFQPGTLFGADFSPQAISVSQSGAATRHLAIEYRVADATSLSPFPTSSFDIVVDKGCLDCFISSTSTDPRRRLASYFSAVARVLRDGPTSRFLLVPVNAADVPHLVHTGAVRLDVRALVSGGADTERGARGVKEAWDGKGVGRDGGSGQNWRSGFVVAEVRAQDEKHMYVLEEGVGHGASDLGVVCNGCERVYSGSLPESCSQCSNRLRRFALS